MPEVQMVSIEFEKNRYQLTPSGVWIGTGGPNGGRYPGLYCAAPMVIWPELISAAITQGYEKSDLAREVPKKAAKSSAKKAYKKPANSISIF
jgi:hypothetical protein